MDFRSTCRHCRVYPHPHPMTSRRELLDKDSRDEDVYIMIGLVVVLLVLLDVATCVDLYATLGVDRVASISEIKKAYRTKVHNTS